MSLGDLWFVIVAIFWTGFFVLEGFDFGVGALHHVIGRTERERRVAINTIGPFWDGNEVWLVVGGAAIFAAFPAWYATWFSASYLAVLLLLAALILRGVSFEFRGKGGDRWRGSWSLALTVGSLVAPTVLGIALGDLLAGLPVNGHEEFTGSFWDLFTGFGLWTGLTVLLLCLLHGATFLALRTTGELSARARESVRCWRSPACPPCSASPPGRSPSPRRESAPSHCSLSRCWRLRRRCSSCAQGETARRSRQPP